MKRIDRNLTISLGSLFTKEALNNLARETKFIQRTGSLTAEGFISLCAFSGVSRCKDSLSNLSSNLTSEASYLPKLRQYIEPRDLILRDLGYFKIEDLNFIDKSKAYYISKVKKCTVKELGRYSQVNILDIGKNLEPGQTYEIPEAYLGTDKILKTRIIITKLSEKDKRKRELRNIEESKRSKSKSRMNPEGLDIWNGINVYATNQDENTFTASQIHALYTLRWQVEIMFKIWKSVFTIEEVKK